MRRGLLTPGGRLYVLVGIAALAAFYAMPCGHAVPGHDLLPGDRARVGRRDRGGRRLVPAGASAGRGCCSRRASCCFVAGDVLFGVLRARRSARRRSRRRRTRSTCSRYPVLAAGLWLLVRQRSTRTDWTSLIDAATVTVALGIVAWELLIVHYTRDDSLSLAEKLVSIAYPLGDVLLLAVAARLLFGTGRAHRLVHADRALARLPADRRSAVRASTRSAATTARAASPTPAGSSPTSSSARRRCTRRCGGSRSPCPRRRRS